MNGAENMGIIINNTSMQDQFVFLVRAFYVQTRRGPVIWYNIYAHCNVVVVFIIIFFCVLAAHSTEGINKIILSLY